MEGTVGCTWWRLADAEPLALFTFAAPSRRDARRSTSSPGSPTCPPGREHDTTCAKAPVGLLSGLEVLEHDDRIPTPTDLGYENLSPAIRHSHKRPKGGELTGGQTTYNKVIRGVHGVAERASALLEEKPSPHSRLSASTPGALMRSPRPPTSYSTSNTTGLPRRLHQVRACQPPCPERLIVSCLM